MGGDWDPLYQLYLPDYIVTYVGRLVTFTLWLDIPVEFLVVKRELNIYIFTSLK
jgi:hypothetical protein